MGLRRGILVRVIEIKMKGILRQTCQDDANGIQREFGQGKFGGLYLVKKTPDISRMLLIKQQFEPDVGIHKIH